MRETLRELAKWRPPEPLPDEEGVDEEGRPYVRVYLQFWETPKPWILGVWVANYWMIRRLLGRFASRFARPS